MGSLGKGGAVEIRALSCFDKSTPALGGSSLQFAKLACRSQRFHFRP